MDECCIYGKLFCNIAQIQYTLTFIFPDSFLLQICYSARFRLIFPRNVSTEHHFWTWCRNVSGTLLDLPERLHENLTLKHHVFSKQFENKQGVRITNKIYRLLSDIINKHEGIFDVYGLIPGTPPHLAIDFGLLFCMSFFQFSTCYFFSLQFLASGSHIH